MKKNQHREILERSRQLKRRRRVRRLSLAAAASLVLISLGVGLAHYSRFLIKQITVTGAEIVSTDEIEAAAQAELAGNYWWVFPRRNVLLYPQSELTRVLLDRFAQLVSAEVRLEGSHTLAITVKERKTEAVSCDTLGACYSLDQKGLPFATAPEFTGHLFFQFLTASSSAAGKPSLSPADFSRLLRFKTGLNQSLRLALKRPAIEAFAAEAVEAGDYNFLLGGSGTPASEAVAVKVNLDQDLAEALENLRSALRDKALFSLLERNFFSLDYLDLRFPPKVFYKML